MYFWDYGNAFLLEASRVGADVVNEDGSFRYPSYVEDIMGPLCFDYGFGPYRWVCTNGDPADLARTDAIAAEVLMEMRDSAPDDVKRRLTIICDGYAKQVKTNWLLAVRPASSTPMMSVEEKSLWQ